MHKTDLVGEENSGTVRNYSSNIFSKLQVADRAQAIVKAREAGLK